MRLLKISLVLAILLLAAMVALARINNDNSSREVPAINEELRTFMEEACIDGHENITCIESTYVQCNGDMYRVAAPTAMTVYEKVYVEKEDNCILEGRLTGEEKPSPFDRIKNSDIIISSEKVSIHLRNAKWRKFIDSNSMDPLIDAGTTTIEIKPKVAHDIKVGDIIAYNTEGFDYAFVHRVVEIGNDQYGIYFITKGDNYWKQDSEKVRFSQVEGIVVGILY